MPQMNDKCANCGATYGIHNGDTDQCPAGGLEATGGKKQRWQASTWRAIDVKDDVVALKAQVEELKRRLDKVEKVSYTDLDGRGKGLQPRRRG
jgi:hypothetical protein